MHSIKNNLNKMNASYCRLGDVELLNAIALVALEEDDLAFVRSLNHFQPIVNWLQVKAEVLVSVKDSSCSRSS